MDNGNWIATLYKHYFAVENLSQRLDIQDSSPTRQAFGLMIVLPLADILLIKALVQAL